MIYISRDIIMFKNCLKDYTESEILAFLNEFFENSKDLKG
ncbi:TPA: bacteriocin immunity protein, partial [Citrobacter koseri]|nr:bacteriocin immunity protein [Citrobacter koseri]